jgi:hypothetical protein
MNAVFWIVLGLIYANIAEWFLHKHVLHNLGKRKDRLGKLFSFHWSIHHRYCRKYNFYDPDYSNTLWAHLKSGEVVGLFLVALIHAPLLLIIPWFVIGAYIHIVGYYVVHRYSHINPKWGRKWLPWHWDHHMGRDQDCNWCVTYPLADYLFGTRDPMVNRQK